MPKYYVVSSHLKPCLFDSNHEIVPSLGGMPFDYNPIKNPDGIYAQYVVEAENEFLAGIEFVRMAMDEKALLDLIDFAFAETECFGEISRELADLIKNLNPLLPLGDQRREGDHFEVEED